MVRAIDLDKRSMKFISSLSAKHAQQIKKKILSLGDNPIPTDSKRLKGYESYYRCDSGEYRIAYRFDETTVYVVLVDKRNDDQIYRLLRRILPH